MKKIKKKFLIIIILAITLISYIQNLVFANVPMTSAYVEFSHDTGYHLQFWDTKQNAWSFVKTSYVEYQINGQRYPAYCGNRDRNGAETNGAYDVNLIEYIQDNRIWRVIKNGYPYKSAYDMGVENNDDAFVSTKHAIYSVIYDIDVRSYYKGGDERGNKIVDAIDRLVNAGRYGTETLYTSTVQVNKIGNFKQDDVNQEYYSQEYYVTAGVGIKEYTIKSIVGFPEGTIITDKSNCSKNTFSANEHFKVLVPKSNIDNNYNGTINLTGKCLTYPVFYGHAPNESLQNYILSYDSWDDIQGKSNLYIDGYKSKIKIIKTSSETQNRIEGINFNFKYENGENIGNYVTDENGEINLSNLKKGIIIVTEIDTTSEYLLNTEENKINLLYDSEEILEVENTPAYPNTEVKKNGIIQTTANEEIKYDFNIKNTGNTELSNFTWYDFLPADYVTVTKLVTGTFNQNLNYAIYYKTNKNDYCLLRDNLNTQENNYIDFSNLELEADEYVTEFKAEFGKVDIGFSSVESPQLFVKVKSNVKNDDIFTNTTKVDGYYKTAYTWDDDNHTTKVYEKKLEVKLPRTGF